MIAERAFHAQLVEQDIAFEDYLRCRRHFQIDGLALHQLQRFLPQESGDQVLLDVRRRGNDRGKHHGWLGSDGDRDLHFSCDLLPFRHPRAPTGTRHHVECGAHGIRLAGCRGATHLFAIVFRTLLLALPMHARAARVIHLQPIGSGITLARFRIFGDDRRQRDEAPAIERPTLQDGKIEQREVVALDHFLTRAGGNLLGEKLAHFGQHGQHLDFVEDALRRLDVHEVLDPVGDLVKRVHIKRHPHATLGAELVDQDLRARMAFDVFEKQRRAAWPVRAARSPLGDAVGDFGDLQDGIGFGLDAL